VSDPRKRIIVDGVDFAELFPFHRIFHAVSASLQPPRLIVGLLIVLTLVTFGKGWDRFDRQAGPDISPNGLLAGDMTERQASQARDMLARAVEQYLPEDDRPEPNGDSAQWTLEELLPLRADLPGYYKQHRADLGTDKRDAADQKYISIMTDIERTRPRSPWEATAAEVTGSFRTMIRSAVSFDVPAIYTELGDIFYRAPVAMWRTSRWFTVAFGIFLVIVLAIGGGALSRMSATQIAGQERLRVRTAIAFSVNNWRRFGFAILLPVLLALLVALVIMVFGLLMNVPGLDILGSVLYGLALILGFVFAFLLFGYAAGFSLLVPAVACENCDPGDAMQRAFAYVINRPLHLLWYAVVALVGLVLGYLVVAFIASVMLNLTAVAYDAASTHSAVSAAGGYTLFDLSRDRPAVVFANWHELTSAWFINVWETIIVTLVAGYVFVYYYSASTVMYLLMRRAADGQDIEEIWRPGLVPGTLAPIPEPPRSRLGVAHDASQTARQNQD